jgi:hypothetical protein
MTTNGSKRSQDNGLPVRAYLPRELAGGLRRPGAVVCDALGCDQPVKYNKTFCVLHIEREPYVTDLLNRLAQYEEEAANIEAGNYRDNKLHVTEVLGMLECSPTVEAGHISKNLMLSIVATKGFLRYMEGEGMLKVHVKRKSKCLVVTL